LRKATAVYAQSVKQIQIKITINKCHMTIQTLSKIYQTIDKGIPQTAASPDTLVNHLNDLYGESTTTT
jgi:hypothetical protein